MNKKQYLERVISLLIYITGLVLLFYGLGHSILNNNQIDIFLFSSFSALAINILLINCFFEKPKDVIASSLNILILLAGLYIDSSFSRPLLNSLVIYAAICLSLSTASIYFYNPEEKANNWKQVLSGYLKKSSSVIGNSKVIFSVLIASLLIYSYSKEDVAFYSFMAMGLILLINDPIRQLVLNTISFIKSWFIKKTEELPDPIGHIAAVQSIDTFVIDLIDISKRPSLHVFDFIDFKYGADNTYIRGFIIDRYYLDSQQKIKVFKTSIEKITDEKKKLFSAYKNNVAYKIKEPSETERQILENFVGTIIEKSNISEIKFEYSSKKILTNGDLLAVEAKNKAGNKVSILYQVTQAQTNIKSLENRNEIGLIEATAIQLGVWQSGDIRNFENYGWVPQINTPVLLASEVNGPEKQNEEIQIGTIEDTAFKVLVNIKDLVTHHTAILGTTGTGKSVFSRKLIKELALSDNKIFCIDLTGEAKKFLSKYELINNKNVFTISKQAVTKKIGDYVKQVVDTRGSNYGKNPAGFDELTEGIEKYIKAGLTNFIEDETENIGVFELPELSNTEETLEYTKFFFKALFDLAKEGVFKEKRACLVLEEAHTLIPEWNSVGGTDDKTAKRLTNTIAQIALQGRKYNVGLLVIAQRTANVSKTILTQCNTIISFKQFDNTSKEFLVNHFGDGFISSLSMLKNRRAIIAGKALVSDVPIIFKVPEIIETELQEQSVPVTTQIDPHEADGAFVDDAPAIQGSKPDWPF